MAIADDVRLIIAKALKIPVEQLTTTTRLDEIGAESLDVIEIVFELEEKFNISIPFKAEEGTRLLKGEKSEQQLPFATIGDIVDLVTKLVAAKAPQ